MELALYHPTLGYYRHSGPRVGYGRGTDFFTASTSGPLFGELIILIVYLPILTLQGIEGKLFRPMALTVVFALFASMLLSLTLMPALCAIGLRPGRSPREPLLVRLAHRLYEPVLEWAMRRRAW